MTADFGRIVPAPDVRVGMSAAASRAPTVPSVLVTLLPIMAAVSIAFLVIGLALPVLPLHVHRDLGLGTFAVGLVTGSQFVAALVSRVWAAAAPTEAAPSARSSPAC
jgi:hypothetical protein